MISGTHTPDSGSVQLYGRHKAWKLAPGGDLSWAGKGRRSSISHPVITVRGSGGASRQNAISHQPQQNKSQNWSKYEGQRACRFTSLGAYPRIEVINEGNCIEWALAPRLLMNEGWAWARQLGGWGGKGLYEFFINFNYAWYYLFNISFAMKLFGLRL